ncbi:hypothetical protein C2S51_014106 [Perilla frutescens var. frutescens]|nr:hypothetical protein C2S51_014106 [Perilla frutescens var. frutescens]
MRDLAVGMGRKQPGSPLPAVSPRSADAGEVDTRAPFQSVKDAVNLFVEATSPKATTPVARKKAEERLLEVEAQHHMMLKARLYYTDQMKSAEAAKTLALRELQMANKTLQQITIKLQSLTDSKQAAIGAKEAAKLRAEELEVERARRAKLGSESWKLEVNKERELYKTTTAQLLASQQELAVLRQDFDAALIAKLAMFQRSEAAQGELQKNRARESPLLNEVEELRQKLDQVKLASLQAEEEYTKLVVENEVLLQSHKLAKEQVEKEIDRLQEEYEPTETLQEKLEETMEAIGVLQEQLNDIQSSDLYAIQKMASELDSAKRALEEAVAEEKSLRNGIDSTISQLADVKKERPESEKKALEAESTAEQMQADLERSKAELETAMSGCGFIMQSCIEKLLEEAEVARDEAQERKKSAGIIRQEAIAAMTVTQAAEEKLKIALKEAEEAKAAERIAEERINNYPGNDAAESHGSRSTKRIRLSVEEFDLMNKKIEECRNKADVEVATALAQVEAINAREREISDKLEAMLEENEAIQSEIRDALKKAEMAEAARRLVENELQKWRQNEQSGSGKAR